MADRATAFVVWIGIRDDERPVAACATREAADRWLVSEGIEVRANYYGRQELLAPSGEPCGVVEVEWVDG